jgi:hypothetical protein
VGKVEDFDVVSSLMEKLQPGGRLGKILADKENQTKYSGKIAAILKVSQK